jgi:hypothetical protein
MSVAIAKRHTQSGATRKTPKYVNKSTSIDGTTRTRSAKHSAEAGSKTPIRGVQEIAFGTLLTEIGHSNNHAFGGLPTLKDIAKKRGGGIMNTPKEREKIRGFGDLRTARSYAATHRAHIMPTPPNTERLATAGRVPIRIECAPTNTNVVLVSVRPRARIRERIYKRSINLSPAAAGGAVRRSKTSTRLTIVYR